MKAPLFSASLLFVWLCLASAAQAATITVTNTVDGQAGSLRNAIANASPGDTIVFANTLSGQTLDLVEGGLSISKNLTIDASTLAGGLVISPGGFNQGLGITSATVILRSLTLYDGYCFGAGGAISVGTGATLFANDCSISSNIAFSGGGGICNNGTVTLNNCTLSGNGAVNGSNGGGIVNYGTVTLINCTLSDNVANTGDGGGILNDGALSMTNTIVAGNTAYSDADISGAFSGAGNFTNGNPQLAPLGNYGGPTQTMPPLTGSPVIDAGTDTVTNFLTTDQRGYARWSGAHVDIGAVEVQFAAVPPNNQPRIRNAIWFSAGGSNAFQFAFTNVADADFTAFACTNVARPLANWTVLGNISEISPGRYQFTDPSATNYPQRFYRVVSP